MAAATDSAWPPPFAGQTPEPAATTDAVAPAADLEAFATEIAGCTKCRLSEGRTQVVFGVGNPHADLMFVGEGHQGSTRTSRATRSSVRRESCSTNSSAGSGCRGMTSMLRTSSMPPARESRPDTRRDRGLRGSPLPPDLADRAARHRNARELRDGAALGQAARHHACSRRAPADHLRRPVGSALPALPPRGGPLHAGDASDAGRGLREAARAPHGPATDRASAGDADSVSGARRSGAVAAGTARAVRGQSSWLGQLRPRRRAAEPPGHVEGRAASRPSGRLGRPRPALKRRHRRRVLGQPRPLGRAAEPPVHIEGRAASRLSGRLGRPRPALKRRHRRRVLGQLRPLRRGAEPPGHV